MEKMTILHNPLKTNIMDNIDVNYIFNLNEQ